MRLLRILFLSFITYSALGQSGKLDSLLSLIQNNSAKDTIKVITLNEISNQYLWIDFYSSIRYADEALALSRQLGYTKGIARANNLKGFCYWAFGDNELAIEKGLESYTLAEREKSSMIRAESCLILSRAYMDQSERTKAAAYLSEAETIANQAKNWDQLSRVYNLAGVIQFIEQKEDTALQLYTKSLSIVEQHNLPRINLPRILSNIGECYSKKSPDFGFPYFNKALQLAKETGNKTAEASTCGIMGHVLLKKGDYSKAEKYFQDALLLARKLGLRRVIRNVYAGLVDVRLKQGKATEAVEYLKNYYSVRDSLINTSKTRQIVEMETRHEIEKKEAAIKLLEQEKQIQNLWRNILMTAVVVLIALLIAAYHLQKYRERKNLEILNLEIDYLTKQHKEISEKYKTSLLGHQEKTIESQDQRLLKKAIQVVEDNISDPSFSVEKMAREMGMSRANMHRKVKAITGFAPSELIRTIRLRKAASMILNQVDSVSQISIAVGFEDHSYFSKSFKKQFGVPPSEYVQSSILQQEALK